MDESIAVETQPTTEPILKPKRHWTFRLAKFTLKFTFYLVFVFLLLFFTALIALQFPSVQNKIVPPLVNLLQNELKTKVEVGKVDLELFDKVVLNEVKIYDRLNTLMIHVPKLSVGLISFDLWEMIFPKTYKQTIAIRSANLTRPMLRLYERHQDGDLNIDFLFESDKKDTTTSKTDLKIRVGSIYVDNMKFFFTDSNTTEAKRKINKGHLNYQNIAIHNASVNGTFEFEKSKKLFIGLHHLTAFEKNAGVKIDTLSTEFSAFLPTNKPDSSFQPHIELNKTLIKIQETRLDFDGKILNETFKTLFKGKNKKDYRVHFRPSTVSFRVIDYFPPVDLPLHGIAQLEGDVKLDLKNIKGKDVKILFNDRSRLNCDFHLRDFTDADNLFLTASLKDSYFVAADLDTLLKEVELPKIYSNIGAVTIDGKFIGFPNDFVADATFQGPIGDVTANMNMKIGQEISYKGFLQTRNFNIDKLLDLKDICHDLNFDGNVEGKNFSPEKVDTKFDFSAFQTHVAGQLIDSVSGKVDFIKKLLSGNTAISDSQGVVNAHFIGDWREKMPRYLLSGEIQNLNLKHYKLVTDSVFLSSILDFKFKGDSLDLLNGFMHAFKIELTKPKSSRNLQLEDLELIVSSPEARKKHISLVSNLLDCNIYTDLLYKEAPEAILSLVEEFKLYFKSDLDSIGQYYSRKKRNFKAQYLQTNIQAFDLKPLAQYLGWKFRVAGNSQLDVDFRFGHEDRIDINFDSDSLKFSSVNLYNIHSEFTFDKTITENQWEGKANIGVKKLKSGEFQLDNIFLKPNLKNQDIFFTLDAEQTRLKNKLHLQADILIDTISTLVIDSSKSTIALGPTQWNISNQNLIYFTDKYIQINDLHFFNGNQFVAIEGEISNNQEKLVLRVHDLQLSTVHKVYPLADDLQGVINAKVKIRKPFSSPIANINGTVSDLKFGNFLWGQLLMSSDWYDDQQLLALSLGLYRDNDTLLGIAGHYDPKSAKSPLDFHLTTHNLPLQIAEPFIKGIFYEPRGSLNLIDLKITGVPDKPKIMGTGSLKNASVGVDYLKTKFKFDPSAEIKFNESELEIPSMTIYDMKGNPAKLAGYVQHKQLSQFYYLFRINNIHNVSAMNTTKKDNELFYGKGIVKNGWVEITGDGEMTNINAELVTAAGTVINIPISSYTQGSRLDFVHFKGQSHENHAHGSKVSVSGLQLNLTIEATPEADVNIIFDEKAGDIIHANGNGSLNMIISPEGDFNMFGNYDVSGGDYLFTAENIINKKFILEPNGTLNWTGSPYDAQIHLDASYRLNASLSSLDTTLNASRRVPVQVLMKLRGSLLSPQIDLSILLPQLTDSDALVVIQQLRNIENDVQELNRQVFSLLMFGRFAPPNSFFGGGNTAASSATSSISELISNQLNSWLGQAFNDDFGVTVSSQRFDDLTLRMQAKLFNNRVTVIRDGAVMNSASRDLTIGNISIQIRLLPNPSQNNAGKTNQGVLALEIFNRENLGYTNTLLSTNRGIGIFYKKEFDNLIDLFKKKEKPLQVNENE